MGSQMSPILQAAYLNLLSALGPICSQQLSQGPSTSFLQAEVTLGKSMTAALAAHSGLLFPIVENSNNTLNTF